MNKVIKALIIGGLLIVAGSILAGIGVAASKIKGRTSSKIGTSAWIDYTYEALNSNISTLDIDLSYEDVKIESTTDKKISIVYKDNADSPTKIIEEHNSTLSIKSKSTSSYNGFFNVTDLSKLIAEGGFDKDDFAPVVINVPTNYEGKLYISTTSGDISLSDITAHDVSRISAVSGTIAINDLQFEKETDIATTSGDISICNTAFNDTFAATAISGEISLLDITSDAASTIATTSGDITLINLDTKGVLQLNTVSGDVKSNTTSANSIDIETTSGGVNFDKSTVETSFSASTVSGDCNLDFTDKLENYSAYIETTSGDCNLPSIPKSGAKNLSITTTSGDMNITFAEN